MIQSDKDKVKEQLDELMDYPCDFPLKVFGVNNEHFEPAVIDILRIHCDESIEFRIKRNTSRNGKYQSLTVNFTAHSRQQLDAIYQSLTDCELVVMSL